jgi:hypothetical protein
MLNSNDQAIALTQAELAIDENGCKSIDDIPCYVESIAIMWGDEIAEEAGKIILELLTMGR